MAQGTSDWQLIDDGTFGSSRSLRYLDYASVSTAGAGARVRYRIRHVHEWSPRPTTYERDVLGNCGLKQRVEILHPEDVGNPQFKTVLPNTPNEKDLRVACELLSSLGRTPAAQVSQHVPSETISTAAGAAPTPSSADLPVLIPAPAPESNRDIEVERDFSSATIDQLQAALVGKRVMVLGTAFPPVPPSLERYTPTANRLVSWYEVSPDGAGNFARATTSRHAPVNARGQVGEVVSVKEQQTGLSTRNSSGNDVFGKPTSAIANPYVTLVVRMPDGATHYSTTGYPSSLIGSQLQLMSRIERYRVELGGYLASLVGKKLLKVGYTTLYKSDTPLVDLLDHTRRQLAVDRSVANLTAMTVSETKYLEAENAIAIGLLLPDGSRTLLFSSLDHYRLRPQDPPLERMGIQVLQGWPKSFKDREIKAIREAEIFRGMSEAALFASWGYPDKSNDWGRGGRQLIFGSTQYVYTKDDRVTDWQSFR